MVNVSYVIYVASFITLACTAAVGVYGVLAKRNIIKKIIALTIVGDTANTFAILLGFRVSANVMPPVLPSLNPSKELLTRFAGAAVDPVPQALVITAIVINLAITAFLLFLAVRIYSLYGTLDYGKVIRVRRGELDGEG